ncbi:MAG: branched-chain amino acid ABC transporter permease [candidate division WOR-3 bacterium]
MAIQFFINGIIKGCEFTFIAIGLGLIYKTTKILHISHGAIYVTAMYIFYFFSQHLGIGMPFALILCLVLITIIGALTEIAIYYPLYRKRANANTYIIASLGLYIIIINIISLFFTSETKIISSFETKTLEFQNIILTNIQILEFFAALFCLVLFFLLINKTKLGKIIKAFSDNVELASALGINIRQIRIAVFAIGSFLAGLGACLVALDRGFDPFIGMDALFISAAAMIIGGIYSFVGPFIGAMLIGVLQNLVIWQTTARWESAITFALLIIFLRFKPQGVISIKKRIEEL